MDFEELKRVPLGDVATAIVKEGGAVTGGLVMAGFAGRQAENALMGATPVTPTSSLIDKAKAFGANVAPKAIGWYLLKGKVGIAEDFKKGLVTSAAFDLLMRLLNAGVNPATASVMGYQILGDGSIVSTGSTDADIQKMVQENSALRTEVHRLRQLEGAMDPRLPPYVGSQAIPPAERERKWSFMQPAIPGQPKPPGTRERQTRYGFAGEVNAMDRTTGRPGAAYVQAGKMFGMR